MYYDVKVKGKAYPCNYGMAALSEFLDAEGLKLSDLSTFGQDMALSTALRLVYIGLKDGARKAKKEFNLSFEDVCDLVDDDQELITRCMEVFVKSMPQAKPDAGNVEAPMEPAQI